MKFNKKIKIMPMKFPEDKDEIGSWQQQFENNQNFKSIEHFILEDNIFYSLGEVIETNYEIIPIGDDERKLAFVAKTEDGKVVAWLLMHIFDLNTTEPQMFLQYIVIHPEYQKSGIGTQIANEIFLNTKKYVGVKPTEIFSYIHQDNIASQNLFKKFNFSLYPSGDHYLRALTNCPKFVGDKNQIEPGE